MRLVGGLIGAVIGGIIGGAIWAVVVKFSGWEIGWLAWGVGALVGFGFRAGAKDLANPATGVLAAAVALIAVFGGKYAVAHLYTQEALAAADFEEMIGSEEFVLSCVADGVVDEWYADGRDVEWPAGVDPDDAATEAEYPTAVWTEAERRWNAMSAEDQQKYRNDIIAYYGNRPGMETEMSIQLFLSTLGPFDLLWAFLAVATAFGMGAKFEASTASA